MKRTSVLVVLAAAAGLVVARLVSSNEDVTLRAARETNPSGHTRNGGPIAEPFLPRDHGPFATAQKVTLEEAEEAVSFPLVRPQHALANDLLIRAVYVEIVSSGEGGVVEQGAIDYETGILLILSPATLDGFDSDPQADYEAMADAVPGAQVQTVNGVPAFVFESADGTSPAAIDLTLDGVRAILTGEYAPVDLEDLVGVAESLH